jgi:hypothetical protein
MFIHLVNARAPGGPHTSPMTSDELNDVRQAAQAVARAARAGDLERRATRFAYLQSVLAEVRERRGNHPVLWELEADFTSDPAVAADLYRRAEKAASEAGLPTLSIRLSLARLLFKELGHTREAQAALQACSQELRDASEKQSAAWSELLAACDQRMDTPRP